MRNLTIKRDKTFVGCAMKIYIYIKRNYTPNESLNEKNLELLCTLKNNESATVQIPNESVAIIAAYKSLAFTISDLITIPAGEEDAQISGKPHLNPFKGNPFIFDI